MSLTPLTSQQIKAITNKTHFKCQVKELKALGIDHRIRSDGSPLVFEYDVNQGYKVPTVKENAMNLSAA